MPTLGEAFIEVHADTGPFDRELAGSIEAALIKAEAAMRSRGRDSGNAFSEGVQTAIKDRTKHIGDDLAKDLVKSTEGVGKHLKNALGLVNIDLTPHLNESALNRQGSMITRWASNISSSFQNAFQSVSGLFTELQGVGAQFTSISVLANPAVLVTAFGLLGGAVFGLAQVLNPLAALVLTLPGIISGLGAAGLVLYSIFNNMGKAMKAAFNATNATELKAAIAGFTPQVQGFLKALYQFGIFWRNLVDITQTRFFGPMSNALNILAKFANNSQVLAAFGTLASALGQFANALIKTLLGGSFFPMLVQLLPVISSIISKLSGPFLTLLNGLFDLIIASLPFMQNLATLLGDAMQSFGAWLSKISKNGSLADFFNKAVESLQVLGEVAKSAWGFVSTILDALNKDQTGNNFFRSLAVAFNVLNNFFSSKFGQDAIKSMVTAAEGAVVLIAGLIITLTTLWQTMIYIFQAIGLLGQWFYDTVLTPIGHAITAVFTAIVDGFNSLTNPIEQLGQTIQNAFTAAFNWLDQKWSAFRDTARTAISNTIDFFKSLPNKITNAIGDLGSLLYNAGKNLIQGLINGVQNAVPGLKDALSWVTSMLPNWKGPEDLDKKILQPAGMAIMQGFQQGIMQGAQGVFNDLKAITGMVGAVAYANAFTFGPGSIVQNFNGAQPTPSDGAALGGAVGAGIADTVNQQNMTAKTRAI